MTEKQAKVLWALMALQEKQLEVIALEKETADILALLETDPLYQSYQKHVAFLAAIKKQAGELEKVVRGMEYEIPVDYEPTAEDRRPCLGVEFKRSEIVEVLDEKAAKSYLVNAQAWDALYIHMPTAKKIFGVISGLAFIKKTAVLKPAISTSLAALDLTVEAMRLADETQDVRLTEEEEIDDLFDRSDWPPVKAAE